MCSGSTSLAAGETGLECVSPDGWTMYFKQRKEGEFEAEPSDCGGSSSGSYTCPTALLRISTWRRHSSTLRLAPGTYVNMSGNGLPTNDFVLSSDGGYTWGPSLSGTCSGSGTKYFCTDPACGLPCGPGFPVTLKPNGDLLIRGDDGPSWVQATYRPAP